MHLKKHLAPAGTPVRMSEIVAGCLAASVGRNPSATLARKLSELSGSDRCFLMSSGRAAMTLLLSVIKEVYANEGRDEVIVPAYTCYSVPASIELAGLKVRLCDIDPNTLSLDLSSLHKFDCRRVAAIVTANLYGIPNELEKIEAFAKENNVLLIDDAAQALGARLGDRAVGGFGAAGIYSFDKGKNITTIQGGAALVRDHRVLNSFERSYKKLQPTGLAATAVLLLKLGVYSLALRPAIYEYVQRISALGLGQTNYENDFPVRTYSESLSGISLKLFRRLDELTAIRKTNAQGLRDALTGLPGIGFVEISPSARPAFTRFPFFISDRSEREHALKSLQESGIGATASYPLALCDVPEVARLLPSTDLKMVGAQQVARSIVTLPTHPYCPPDLGQQVVARILQ
jgi:dTDP-4-amino-4,6-dideoxygalactose transaminase